MREVESVVVENGHVKSVGETISDAPSSDFARGLGMSASAHERHAQAVEAYRLWEKQGHEVFGRLTEAQRSLHESGVEGVSVKKEPWGEAAWVRWLEQQRDRGRGRDPEPEPEPMMIAEPPVLFENEALETTHREQMREVVEREREPRPGRRLLRR